MLIGELARCRKGLAALEFALIAPLAILLLLGVFDISRAMIVQQDVWNAAHAIPISASVLAVQADGSTALTVTQVQQSLSAVFAEIPWRRSGALTGMTSATMTSVTFTQTDATCVQSQTNTCSFAPHVAWSVAYQSHGLAAVTRPCGQLNQLAAPGTPGDLASLPTSGVVDPDPILVVDVHYQFTPLFYAFASGPIDFWASGYWSVRSVNTTAAVGGQYTKYDVANAAGGVGKCTGYS